jgi:hypothetical protein
MMTRKLSVLLLFLLAPLGGVSASIVMKVTGTLDKITPTHLVIRSETTLITVPKAALNKDQAKHLTQLGKPVVVMLTPAQIESVKELPAK